MRYIILCLLVQTLSAQIDNKIQYGIQFLSSEHLASVNFGEKDYSGMMDITLDQFSTKLGAQKLEKGHILLVQTFHKEEAPSYTVHACPALSEGLTASLATGYESGAMVLRSKLGDYSIIYVAMIEEGCSEADFQLVPDFKHPRDLAMEALQAADLAEKVDLIQDWAQKEALPALSTITLMADIEFAGVRSMGHLMQDIDFSKKQDIIELTDKREDYWRGLMEMSPRNHLVSVSKIMMHIAQSEFDYAKPYIALSSFFADSKSAATYYLEELKWRLTLFQEALDAAINKGIAMHDAKDYAGAMAQYESILEAYPNSAWARYELYFSKNEMLVMEDKIKRDDYKLWQEMKGAIYACNPLYHMDVRASNGQEAYLLARRMKTQQLFGDEKKFLSDLFEYAEIALDLDLDAFAAHLYWYIFTTIDAKKYEPKAPLTYYLYAMNRMGIKDFAKLFKEIKVADFKKIDKEREAMMKESDIYKSFAK